MSYKEKIEIVRKDWKTTITDLTNGQIVSSGVGSDQVALTSFRSGIEQPFYKQMILNRAGATSALTASRQTCSFSQGSISVTERSIKWNPNGTYDFVPYREHFTNNGSFVVNDYAPPLVDGSTQSSSRAKALEKYYSKLQEIQKSAEGQVMAVELRETLRLLRKPFQSGIALLKALMSNSSTFRGPVKKSGDLWLQYRFGILPLIQDCEDIVKIIKKEGRKESVGSNRVYGQSYYSDTSAWTANTITNVQLEGTLTQESKAETIIRFGYHHEAVTANLAAYQDLHASFLNPRDIPNTIWETIPWSFLIDYFLNIGAIINAATTYQGNVVWTSVSTVITGTSSLVISNHKKHPSEYYVISNFTPGRLVRTTRRVQRSTEPPGIPPLVFELPGSNIKLANIAALLTGLLKGK